MCVFCKIVNREQGADIVYENERVIAFKDINPKAPVHILIVPKKHIASINDIAEEDCNAILELLITSNKVAKEQKIDDGYRLVFNVGRKGGQVIDHVHLHLLGGWE
jgi:histidine triad (HIT) family protein